MNAILTTKHGDAFYLASPPETIVESAEQIWGLKDPFDVGWVLLVPNSDVRGLDVFSSPCPIKKHEYGHPDLIRRKINLQTKWELAFFDMWVGKCRACNTVVWCHDCRYPIHIPDAEW